MLLLFNDCIGFWTSNLKVAALKPNADVKGSVLANCSVQSCNCTGACVTGGGPRENAADRSTFGGMKPRLIKFNMPFCISSSAISGGGALGFIRF